MKMSSIRSLGFVILAGLAVLGVGCGDDGPPTVPDGPIIDPPLPWWTPEPGEASNWDLQLVAPHDTSVTRQMYMLDLWDVAPGGTITYDDATTVPVPAGVLAGAITTVKNAGAIVVCHIDSGAIRLTDPDVSKFPGFDGPPNDRPTDPAAGSVVGWSVIGDANTRYLDLRTAGRALWDAAMFKRFDYAKSIGCDGIDAGWIDQQDPGFPSVGNDIALYYADIVGELHARELSAGFHASSFVGKSFSAQFAADYDFAVIERCAEFDECDLSRAFSQASKAEFAIDYLDDGTTDRDMDGMSDGISFTGGCGRMNLPTDWIHKDADAAFRPSNTYRMARSECP